VESLKSVKQEYVCEYDAYVSYNGEDEMDSEWVVNQLIPAVEREETGKVLVNFLKWCFFY
jgi:hypothetical protein